MFTFLGVVLTLAIIGLVASGLIGTRPWRGRHWGWRLASVLAGVALFFPMVHAFDRQDQINSEHVAASINAAYSGKLTSVVVSGHEAKVTFTVPRPGGGSEVCRARLSYDRDARKYSITQASLTHSCAVDLAAIQP